MSPEEQKRILHLDPETMTQAERAKARKILSRMARTFEDKLELASLIGQAVWMIGGATLLFSGFIELAGLKVVVKTALMWNLLHLAGGAFLGWRSWGQGLQVLEIGALAWLLLLLARLQPGQLREGMQQMMQWLLTS